MLARYETTSRIYKNKTRIDKQNILFSFKYIFIEFLFILKNFVMKTHKLSLLSGIKMSIKENKCLIRKATFIYLYLMFF